MSDAPQYYQTHLGDHGWLVRFLAGPMFVVRIIPNGAAGLPQPIEGAIEDRPRDAHSLAVVLHGEVPAYAIDAIKCAIAGTLDLDQRRIAVRVEQLEEKKLHRGLKQIDRVLDVDVVDLFQVIQRSIHVDARIAARARRAASRSLMADNIAVSGLRRPFGRQL